MFKQIVVVRKLDDPNNLHVEENVASVRRFCNLFDVPVYDAGDEAIDYSVPVLIVTVGGDGTVLYGARESFNYQTAHVFPIASGNVGFLANDQFSDSQLWDLFEGCMENETARFITDTRMALAVKIFVEGELLQRVAINEVMVTPEHPNAPMMFQIATEDGYTTHAQGASGIALASPTGSTAVSMSAGGSIIHPSSHVILATPIAPSSLGARPMVFSGNNTVSVWPYMRKGGIVDIYIDGQRVASSYEDCRICVERHPVPLRFIRPNNWSFFRTLEDKLMWGK